MSKHSSRHGQRDEHGHRGWHGPGTGRLVRSRDQRMVGGVASGIAEWRGFNPMVVRMVFVVATVAGGSGVLLYVVGWLLLPSAGSETSLAQQALQSPREPAHVATIAFIVIGSMVVMRSLGLWFSGATFPVGLAGIGLAVVWRQGDEYERAPLVRMAAILPWARIPAGSRRRRLVFVRIAVGAVLVAAGVAAFLAESGALPAVRDGLLGTIGIVGGLALIFGPWWWRLAQELTEERRERVRSQERAEVAAHLHDSVLQTLALIQRAADDPRAVTTLARRQERELRAWLFEDPPDAEATTISAAIRQAAEQVEERHGVAIDAVTVGDGPLDDAGTVLVAACQEAMVNAAKWSGQATVSVFAEVEPTVVSVFVRDRGTGFDLSLVAADRKGISQSIVGRMERHGGKAVVRTDLGAGTEVELRLPRAVP